MPSGAELQQSGNVGEELVREGQTLAKIQTQFVQAIKIIKPRDRVQIVTACEEEATIAGEEFYYSWTINTKNGPKLVEGLSYQAAVMEARNWGNCANAMQVEEREGSYIFTPTFIDMETGFNFQRAYRQRKSQNMGKGYKKDSERQEDITFQIGQSKAIRNVVLGAIPSWLHKKVLTKAKEKIVEFIEKIGKEEAINRLLVWFEEEHKVSKERIENKIGKKAEAWDKQDIALLYGGKNAVEGGQETANEMFPSIGQDTANATDSNKENLKNKIKGKKDTGEKKDNMSESADKTIVQSITKGIEKTSKQENTSQPDNTIETRQEEFERLMDGHQKKINNNKIYFAELGELGFTSPTEITDEKTQKDVLAYFEALTK